MNSGFNKSQCDQFSKFNKLDLLELLNQLEEHYITYQDKLEMPLDSTFGIEIEFENAPFREIRKKIELLNLDSWFLHDDISVQSTTITTKFGGEISSPILKNSTQDWSELKQICAMLKDSNAVSTSRTGGHIHFGKQLIKKDLEHWCNFLKLWALFEAITYRFGYGEYLKHRNSASSYARPTSEKILDNIHKVRHYQDITSQFAQDRVYGLNLQNLLDRPRAKGTIEFRSPNGTIDESIWQNNVNYFSHFIAYATSQSFDKDLIDQKIADFNYYTAQLNFYNEIYLKDSLLLADLIFDNNLDKANFLKQYLKEFKTEGNKVNKFTK